MQKLLILCVIMIGFVACHQEVSNKSLAEMEQKMREINAEDDSTDIKKAQQALVDAYLEYAKKHTDAIETPDYLFKAAGLTEVVSKNTRQTVKILEQIPQKYPDSERAAQALYRLAVIYQSKMKDSVVSNQYYLELIEKYPNHPLTISLQQ